MSYQVILSEEDVVSVEENSIAGSPTLTIRELMEKVKRSLSGNLPQYENTALGWVYNGIRCRLLSAQGGGWQRGKIRIRFEFIPDEPPEKSPLDDLRSNLDI